MEPHFRNARSSARGRISVLAVVGACLVAGAGHAQSPGEVTCAPWGGELRPLPTTSDPDPVLARWARLRTQDLAREAAALEATDVARAHATWRHAACLSSADPEVAAGLKRTLPVRVHRPSFEKVRARSEPIPSSLDGAVARLSGPVQFATEELAALQQTPREVPDAVPAARVVPERGERPAPEPVVQTEDPPPLVPAEEPALPPPVPLEEPGLPPPVRLEEPGLPPPVPPQREQPSGIGPSFSPGPGPEQPPPEPELEEPPPRTLPPELPDALPPAVSARGPSDAVVRARDALREARYEAVLVIAEEAREKTAEGADRAALEFAAGVAAIALGQTERARESFARAITEDTEFSPDPRTTSPKVLRVFEDVSRQRRGR